MFVQNAKFVSERSRKQVLNSVNMFTDKNVSFADMARTHQNLGSNSKQQSNSYMTNPHPKPNHSQPNNITDFLDEVKSLFSISFKDLLYKIREFWPKYQKLQNKEDKMFAYLEFVASIVV